MLWNRPFWFYYTNLTRLDFHLGENSNPSWNVNNILRQFAYLHIIPKNKYHDLKCISFCVNMYLPQKNPSRTLMLEWLFYIHTDPVNCPQLFRIINSHLSTLEFYATLKWIGLQGDYWIKKMSKNYNVFLKFLNSIFWNRKWFYEIFLFIMTFNLKLQSQKSYRTKSTNLFSMHHTIYSLTYL